MGTIKRGILGGFSGKVANVVGTSWKGIALLIFSNNIIDFSFI